MFSSLLPKPQNVGTKELPQKAYIYKPDNKQMNFNLQKCWINSLENFRKMVQASSSEFSSLFVILCVMFLWVMKEQNVWNKWYFIKQMLTLYTPK